MMRSAAYHLGRPRVCSFSRVEVRVLDEGEFWETRLEERLRERLGAYDRLVAGMAGALKDSLGKGRRGVQVEIINDARFERLKAKGRADFAAKIEEARRIIQGEARGGDFQRSSDDQGND